MGGKEKAEDFITCEASRRSLGMWDNIGWVFLHT